MGGKIRGQRTRCENWQCKVKARKSSEKQGEKGEAGGGGRGKWRKAKRKGEGEQGKRERITTGKRKEGKQGELKT